MLFWITVSAVLSQEFKRYILASGFGSKMLLSMKKIRMGLIKLWFLSGGFSFFGTQAATEPSTADGLTVEGIVANRWTILDESDSDWKSHAAAIAQSIQVIKRRLQVYKSSFDPYMTYSYSS